MKRANHSVGTGLLDSLRMLARSLIAILHTRMELLAIDLEEERERLSTLIALLLMALFFIGLGIVLSTLLIIVMFWDTHRLQVLAGLTGLFLVGGMVAIWTALQKIRTLPRIFAATLAVLYRDSTRLPPH
ncbi:hypothetical protein CAP31_06205 [Sulfuriferula sp. AH1]|uniref:phage holin family protein n=1 Tax=Sulfuriferula sp. AH1 TaxID=1985873 RepID=UPI000B3B2A73|nr:phage holin family protein [Sulfuriferula sp. AH1]ARU31312.1 hypothetical protein CAP31_06205 [Sulfuriferula sp. AH1]